MKPRLRRHGQEGKLCLFAFILTLAIVSSSSRLGFLEPKQAYDVFGIQQFTTAQYPIEEEESRDEVKSSPMSTTQTGPSGDDIEIEEENINAEQRWTKPAQIERRKSHGFGVDILVAARLWFQNLVKFDREVDIHWLNGHWLYAEGVCEEQDFSCYFERPKFDHKPETLNEVIRKITVPSPEFQKAIDEVTIASPENCGVIHVRHADIVLNFGWGNSSETPLLRYIQLGEYVEKFLKVAPNVTNVVLLTDDQDVIDDVPNYDNKNGLKFHYLERKRFRGAEGGWENHFPSGSRWQEMVTIMQTKNFVSGCSAWVGSHSSFAEVMKELMEPRPVFHLLENRVPPKPKENKR